MTGWTNDEQAELQLALTTARLAPEPSGLWIDGGENVAVLTSQGHVIVGWSEIVWRGPVPPPNLTLRNPMHLAPLTDSARLSAAIERARKIGLKRRQICGFCGVSFNPGRRHDRDVCHGCAERRLGVVH